MIAPAQIGERLGNYKFRQIINEDSISLSL